MVYRLHLPGDSTDIEVVLDEQASDEDIIESFWEHFRLFKPQPVLVDKRPYKQAEEKKERNVVYTYDGIGIPYGGEIFHRSRKTDLFYFWLQDSLKGRRMAYINDPAPPEMESTLRDLKSIWEQYGEKKIANYGQRDI